MTSPHEQARTPEQLPLGERYMKAANEHALQIMQGERPIEMGYRSIAAFYDANNLGEHSEEWKVLNDQAGLLLDQIGVRRDSKDENFLMQIQSSAFSQEIPEEAYPQMAALLINGANLFNRTVTENPAVLQSARNVNKTPYHMGNVVGFEKTIRHRAEDMIDRGQGPLAVGQVVTLS